MIAWIILAVLGLFLIWLVLIYNGLVSIRNDVQNAWKQIDVQLKRRHDLIPNLVSTVKGVMEFEQDTLEKVISARAKAVSAGTPASKAESENMLTQALGKLFAVIELSRAQEQPERHAAPGRAHVNREPDLLCPSALQRPGRELSHEDPGISEQRRFLDVQFPARGIFRG